MVTQMVTLKTPEKKKAHEIMGLVLFAGGDGVRLLLYASEHAFTQSYN